MGKKAGGFQALGLDAQLLKGVLGMYSQPTPVQRAVLPAALEGADVACMRPDRREQDRSFLIPLLQHVTRSGRKDEPPSSYSTISNARLARRHYKFGTKMAKFCVGTDGEKFSQTPLVGGESIEGQFNALAKRPAVLHDRADYILTKKRQLRSSRYLRVAWRSSTRRTGCSRWASRCSCNNGSGRWRRRARRYYLVPRCLGPGPVR